MKSLWFAGSSEFHKNNLFRKKSIMSIPSNWVSPALCYLWNSWSAFSLPAAVLCLAFCSLTLTLSSLCRCSWLFLSVSLFCSILLPEISAALVASNSHCCFLGPVLSVQALSSFIYIYISPTWWSHASVTTRQLMFSNFSFLFLNHKIKKILFKEHIYVWIPFWEKKYQEFCS